MINEIDGRFLTYIVLIGLLIYALRMISRSHLAARKSEQEQKELAQQQLENSIETVDLMRRQVAALEEIAKKP